MKKAIQHNESPRALITISDIKILDQQASTCDYVVAYQSEGGLIAKLVSFKPTNSPWCVGFAYVQPNPMSSLKFIADSHTNAIRKAMRAGREILVFETEYEFLQYCIKHHAHDRDYWNR